MRLQVNNNMAEPKAIEDWAQLGCGKTPEIVLICICKMTYALVFKYTAHTYNSLPHTLIAHQTDSVTLILYQAALYFNVIQLTNLL